MIIKKLFTITVALACQVSYAALSARDLDGDLSNGHEGVFDDVLNVTWLADANLMASNSFGLPYGTSIRIGDDLALVNSSGISNWPGVQLWLSQMNTSNYFGYNQWRLPTLEDQGEPCSGGFTVGGSTCGWNVPIYNGENVIINELAYMFDVNFGASSERDEDGVWLPSNQFGVQNGTNKSNLALFTGLNELFWTGSFLTGSDELIWVNNFSAGFQFWVPEFFFESSWVLHDGDIGNPIPLPPALWLFVSVLLSFFGAQWLQKLDGR